MTPVQVNKMLKGFFTGKYHRRNLPVSYYNYFDKKLKKNVKQAFGPVAGQKDLYEDLSLSRQTFAAAKTYQMSRELESAAAGPITYKAYIEKAMPIFERYEVWGDSESNTAAANAQNARHWQTIQEDKELFPMLRYSAIEDAVTSDICKHLDGLTLPVDSELWIKYGPTNHNNCRCTLIQLEKARSTNATKVAEIDKTMSKLVNPIFQVNPGITKELFPMDHPYYTEVPKKDKAFARRNFDLPIK